MIDETTLFPKAHTEILRKDKKELLKLVEHLSSPDTSTKIRALHLLEEVLKELDTNTRKEISSFLLDPLLGNLLEENRRVRELSLKAIARLIKNVPLSASDALKIFDFLLNAPRVLDDEFLFIDFVEVFKNLNLANSDPSVIQALDAMNMSTSERIRVLGIWGLWRLIENNATPGELEKLLSQISTLIASRDEAVIETVLPLVKEIATKYRDSREVITRAIAWLVELNKIKKEGSWLIKGEVESCIVHLSEILQDYYKDRVLEALNTIEELIKEERYDEALIIAEMTRNNDVINWVSEKVLNPKKNRKKPEKISGIVPRPVYSNKGPSLHGTSMSYPSIRSFIVRRKRHLPDLYSSETPSNNRQLIKDTNIQEILEKLKSKNSLDFIDGVWQLYEMLNNTEVQNTESLLPVLPELLRVFSFSNNEWLIDKIARSLAKILSLLPTSQAQGHLTRIFIDVSSREKTLLVLKYYLHEESRAELLAFVWNNYLKKLLLNNELSPKLLEVIEAFVNKIAFKEPPNTQEILKLLKNSKEKTPENLQRTIERIMEVLESHLDSNTTDEGTKT